MTGWSVGRSVGWLVGWLVRSFVRSLVRSFVPSFLRRFVRSFVPSSLLLLAVWLVSAVTRKRPPRFASSRVKSRTFFVMRHHTRKMTNVIKPDIIRRERERDGRLVLPCSGKQSRITRIFTMGNCSFARHREHHFGGMV